MIDVDMLKVPAKYISKRSFPLKLGSFFGRLREAAYSPRRSAVITGIGIVSPVGIGKELFWENLLNRQTGISKISKFDVSGFPSQIAGEVRDFEPKDFLSRAQTKRFSRVTQFACASSIMAFNDSGLEKLDPYRTDIILGSATCAFDELDKQVFNNPTGGLKWVEGSFKKNGMGRVFANAPACAVSLLYNIKGHVTTISSACASGLNAVGMAVERIEDGRSDVAFAGGADCAVNHFNLNLFSAANALSTGNSNPENALCPFDERRTKSVLAEAAGVFVIEEKEHAIARGADIYGEIVSFSQEYENVNEFFMMDMTGEKWSEAIEKAVDKYKNRIDYISAHGPSDMNIDLAETRALEIVFGQRLNKIPISSIKGSTGSPLGAAGALQLASGALSLKSKQLPPTYNYKIPDPDCSLNIVKEATRVDKLDHVLVNTRGLGGVSISLVLRRAKV